MRHRLLALPHYFVLTNVASLIALYQFLRGERYAHWEPIRETGPLSGSPLQQLPANQPAGELSVTEMAREENLNPQHYEFVQAFAVLRNLKHDYLSGNERPDNK
jgi:hypothetical protein